MIKDNERHQMHQRIMAYWIAYYSTLREELPKYIADTESKKIPVFFRTHRRYVRVLELDDGFVIAHRTVPRDEYDTVGYWETFHFHDYRGQTVGAATGRGYPPYGDFMDAEMPTAQEVNSGEYADPMPPENIESRDFISHNRVRTTLSEDLARVEARKNLREHFEEQPPRPS